MNHPEELLADLVGGALSTKDRAVVEAHLASCDRCRRELALVREARVALGSLELVPAPVDVTRAAIQEARVTAASRARGATARHRYRAIQIAAAAAIVAVVAIALPHLGRSPETTTGAGAAAPRERNQEAAVTGALSLEIQRTDYDPDSIAALAAGTPGRTPAQFGTATSPASGAAVQADPGATAGALTCLGRAFPGFTGTPTRLIQARFQGTRAYIGIYLEGPGAGLPADARSVRVASTDACTALSSSRAKL